MKRLRYEEGQLCNLGFLNEPATAVVRGGALN